MPSGPQDGLTLMLNGTQGNLRDCGRVAEMVYEELRRIAKRLMAHEPCDHTMQATALVHEAFIKLQEQTDRSWHDRHHFFAVAAATIRQILVDHGRRRRAVKRGGAVQRVNLDEGVNATSADLDALLALDQALARLEKNDARQAQIVELRYFAGLTVDEIALVMNISERTVKRDWEVARLWLHAELTSPTPHRRSRTPEHTQADYSL